jgi:DNA processing protein
MNPNDWLYDLALTFIPQVGDKKMRALFNHFGSAKAVLNASRKDLMAVDGVGTVAVDQLLAGKKSGALLTRAEEERSFVQKHGIRVLNIQDTDYPMRLRTCEDAPFLLYSKGAARLNADRLVAIIGTRKPSDYGVQLTEELVSGLKAAGVTIVSGLAYGVDAIAHKQSLAMEMPTVGVLAHGLDRMYPTKNTALAREMVQAGGALLTEFPQGTNPDKENFPIRNRIVAGMCDVTVVVESDVKGGSMITAYLAHGYNREVAAFPGRVGDTRAAGCNQLIRRTVAALITNAEDLLDTMGWSTQQVPKAVQNRLLLTFTDEEQRVVDALASTEKLHADELLIRSGMEASQLAATLLQLELTGVVRSLPGKNYRLA